MTGDPFPQIGQRKLPRLQAGTNPEQQRRLTRDGFSCAVGGGQEYLPWQPAAADAMMAAEG
jgi:hypothetical protein